MSVSRRAQLVLRGLAAAGLSVSLGVSMFYWLFPEGRLFTTALIAGCGLALVGVFLSRRPALFVVPFTGLLIGAATYGASFLGRDDLALFGFLVILGPALLATPWFFALLVS